jgi:alkaline phosphatase
MKRDRRYKTHILQGIFAMALAALAGGSLWANDPEKANVIVLMMDGCGATHTTLARWYKGALALDRMNLGGVRTYGSDSLITDSAPAATAFACGHKTDDKYVGILPSSVTIPGAPAISETLKYKPVASVLEGARLHGKATGLVATSNIQHASPAGYSAHWSSRSNYNEIAEQQVYEDIDVVFGGGAQYLLPTSLGGRRTDGENLVDVLLSRGYAYVETADEMEASNAKKIWGLFAEDAMAYDFDRPTVAPHQPSLRAMTQKAIDILSKHKKGFFLFVEGSKIDWASHANDPIGVLSDFLAFDGAVDAALNFAKKDGNTLVLVFADHGNGGMSIGNRSTDHTYSKLPYATVLAPLKRATLTGEGIEILLGSDRSEATVRDVLERYYGINDLTDGEVNAILAAAPGGMNAVVGPMISARAGIGWTTGGHTGEDLFLYHYGDKKSLGMVENTQIAHMCADWMGFKLDKVDGELFVEASSALTALGATVSIDGTDPANKVLVAQKGSVTARMPFSKDLLTVVSGSQQKTHELDGITVYADKSGKVYIPEEAVKLCKKAM